MGAFLLLLLLQLTTCNSLHSIYYVLPQGERCPSTDDRDCHTLSHYIARPYLYFKSHTTVVFLQGNHIMDKGVSIHNANNLTFTTQLMLTFKPRQFTGDVSVTCTNDGGFQFWNSTSIEIHSIRFFNCTTSGSQQAILFFYAIEQLVLSKVAVENNTANLGMKTVNVKTLVMYLCNFTKNGLRNFTDLFGGNVLLVSFTPDHITYNITDVRIINGYHGGLNIEVFKAKSVSLFISHLTTINNTAFGSGGNMKIDIYNSLISYVQIMRIESTKGHSIRTKTHDSSIGSGLFLSLNNLKCVPVSKIVISDSKIDNNFAQLSSGASIIFQNVTSCVVNIVNTIFSHNGINNNDEEYITLPMSLGGGGIGIHDWNTINSQVILTDSYFTGNGAFKGGGFLYDGTCGIRVNITNTTFSNNFGFIGAGLAYFMNSISPGCREGLTLTNITVSENYLVNNLHKFEYHHKTYQHIYYIGSAVSVFTNVFFDLVVKDISVNDNYNMSGMTAYGCDVIFNGRNNKFVNNNSPVIGGGFIIGSSNSLIVNQGNHVLFANNTALLHGGAIYAKEDNNDDSYIASLLYERNIVCSFRTNAPLTASMPLITFEGNKAYFGSGDDFYGGTLDYCLIDNNYNIVYHGLKCPIQKYWSMSSQQTISSSPIAACLCDNNTYNCTKRNLTRIIYPGQFFSVPLVAVGMCEGISKGALVINIERGNITTSIDNQLTTKTCKNFTYSAIPSLSSNSSLVSIDVIQTKQDLFHWGPLYIHVQYLPCPLGFKLAPHSDCMCNDAIQKSTIKVQCNTNNDSYKRFKRFGPNWIAYNNEHNCIIAHVNCPFDYCNPSSVSFDVTSPDRQCSFNRTGTLCGQCKSGYSLMLGSNECSKCSNVHLLLIPVFLIAGLLLIAVLIIFDLTVSSGRINGLIFYANIVKLNESVYFSNENIPVLSQFVSWINLDFGIQTCLYDGLDGYWKTWLQFVFPVYLWLLAIGIIIGCKHSLRLSRYCGRNAVPVLATILLMSYTKLLRNITNVFMYTPITCKGDHNDNHEWISWSFDATLGYFDTKRIPLIIFSLFLLIIGLIYTFLVLTSQWSQRYSYKCCNKSSRDPTVRLKPLIDAYCGPYKDSCRYWSGLLLLVRVILTGIFSMTTGMSPQLNNIFLIGMVVLLMSLAWFIGGMYQTKSLNGLEILSYLNIGLLSLMTQLYTSSYVIGISVSVSLLVFITTILIIVIQRNKIGCVKFKRLHQNHAIVEIDSPLTGSPLVMAREPLIFDFTHNPKTKN